MPRLPQVEAHGRERAGCTGIHLHPVIKAFKRENAALYDQWYDDTVFEIKAVRPMCTMKCNVCNLQLRFFYVQFCGWEEDTPFKPTGLRSKGWLILEGPEINGMNLLDEFYQKQLGKMKKELDKLKEEMIQLEASRDNSRLRERRKRKREECKNRVLENRLANVEGELEKKKLKILSLKQTIKCMDHQYSEEKGQAVKYTNAHVEMVFKLLTNEEKGQAAKARVVAVDEKLSRKARQWKNKVGAILGVGKKCAPDCHECIAIHEFFEPNGNGNGLQSVNANGQQPLNGNGGQPVNGNGQQPMDGNGQEQLAMIGNDGQQEQLEVGNDEDVEEQLDGTDGEMEEEEEETEQEEHGEMFTEDEENEYDAIDVGNNY